MDHVKFWVIASGLAFAFAGGYIFWGPSEKPKKRRKDVIPGLQNVGNTCFLNAVLQALAACSVFITWLKYCTSKKNENDSLASALLQVLRDLNWQSSQTYDGEVHSPTKVIEALRARRWVISNEEQDAHELFHVLTTTLEEDFSAAPRVLSLLEVGKLERLNDNPRACVSVLQKSFIPSSSNQMLKYSSPTRGLLASQLKCKRCGNRYPVRYDNFDSISLVIPTPHWGQLTLQDCLQQFISCELVEDVVCAVCTQRQPVTSGEGSPAAETKTTFIKQLSFGKLPECLCIHIQRTVWLTNGIPMKCFDHVAFPEVLAMDDYVYNGCESNKRDGAKFPWARLIGGSSPQDNCSPVVPNVCSQAAFPVSPAIFNSFQNAKTFSSTVGSQKSVGSGEHMYLLKAVIVHLGDVFSGHFISYRRGPVDGHAQHKWFFTSDLTIKEVPFSEVLQSCAYMLFYEKIAVKKPSNSI